jgi:anti-sigma factor RsiW
VSLELDGELSELGRVRLRAHLDACPDCAAYARGAAAATTALRTEPLEQPTRAIELPRRRRSLTRVLQLAAATLAVGAAVGLGSFLGSLNGPHSAAPSQAAIAATQQPYVERALLALDTSLRSRMPRGRVVPV